MLDYEVFVKRPNGDRIGPLAMNETELDVTLKTNDQGLLTLTLDCCSFNFSDFPIDTRLEVCCTCDCNATTFMLGNAPFFVERREKCESDGTCVLKITATSATGLLARRIIPYPSDQPKGKADNEKADDLLKRLFRENGGDAAQTGNYNAATDATRSWASCISVCPDTGLAPLVSAGFGGQNLLQVMKSIAEMSDAKGTKLYFGIFQPGGCCTDTLQFCTWIDQLGEDNGVILSTDNDTIGNYCISEDFRSTANRVYASGESGVYAIASDANLATTLANDCFALRESATSASNTTGTNAPQDAANAELVRLGKPLQFDGVAGEGDNFRFGCDYNWGDHVKVVSDGYEFETNIDSLHFNQRGMVQTVEPGLSTSASRNGTGAAGVARKLKDLEREIDRLKSML